MKKSFITSGPKGSGVIWVHIVCNIGKLRILLDKTTDDKSRYWREKG